MDVKRGKKNRLVMQPFERKRGSLNFSLDRPPTPANDVVFQKTYVKPFYSPKVKLRTLVQK